MRHRRARTQLRQADAPRRHEAGGRVIPRHECVACGLNALRAKPHSHPRHRPDRIRDPAARFVSSCLRGEPSLPSSDHPSPTPLPPHVAWDVSCRVQSPELASAPQGRATTSRQAAKGLGGPLRPVATMSFANMVVLNPDRSSGGAAHRQELADTETGSFGASGTKTLPFRPPSVLGRLQPRSAIGRRGNGCGSG
jgi:hypothetical protein